MLQHTAHHGIKKIEPDREWNDAKTSGNLNIIGKRRPKIAICRYRGERPTSKNAWTMANLYRIYMIKIMRKRSRIEVISGKIKWEKRKPTVREWESGSTAKERNLTSTKCTVGTVCYGGSGSTTSPLRSFHSTGLLKTLFQRNSRPFLY